MGYIITPQGDAVAVNSTLSFSEKKEAVMDPIFWWPIGIGIYLALGVLVYIFIIALDTLVAGGVLPEENMRATRQGLRWVIIGWLPLLILFIIQASAASILYLYLQASTHHQAAHLEDPITTVPPAPPPQ